MKKETFLLVLSVILCAASSVETEKHQRKRYIGTKKHDKRGLLEHGYEIREHSGPASIYGPPSQVAAPVWDTSAATYEPAPVYQPASAQLDSPGYPNPIHFQPSQLPQPIGHPVPVTFPAAPVPLPQPVAVANPPIARPVPVLNQPIPNPVPVPVPVIQTVTKHVGVPVPVHVDRPVPVHVDRPVPVHVDRPVPVPVAVPVPRPYPVPVEKIVHVEKPVHYPVHVDRPVAVPVAVPYPKPYPVDRYIHVDRPYPVHVAVPYNVPKPYPVPVAIHASHYNKHIHGTNAQGEMVSKRMTWISTHLVAIAMLLAIH